MNLTLRHKVFVGAACTTILGSMVGAAISAEREPLPFSKSAAPAAPAPAAPATDSAPIPFLVPSPAPLNTDTDTDTNNTDTDTEVSLTPRQVTKAFCRSVTSEFEASGLAQTFDQFIQAGKSYTFTSMLIAADDATTLSSVLALQIDKLDREPGLSSDVNYYVEALEVALDNLGDVQIKDYESIEAEYNPNVSNVNSALKKFIGACKSGS